jgi:thiamine phosphate synthase YjbQ (UPF0047 family)
MFEVIELSTTKRIDLVDVTDEISAAVSRSRIESGIDRGKVIPGTWQGIYFCEFDGPRDRMIYVKTIEG